MFFSETMMFVTFPQYFLTKQRCLQLSPQKKLNKKSRSKKTTALFYNTTSGWLNLFLFKLSYRAVQIESNVIGLSCSFYCRSIPVLLIPVNLLVEIDEI